MVCLAFSYPSELPKRFGVIDEGVGQLDNCPKNVTLSPSLYYHRLISAADILAATATANEVPDDS